jgi:osmotically-inducible protein OsmY
MKKKITLAVLATSSIFSAHCFGQCNEWGCNQNDQNRNYNQQPYNSYYNQNGRGYDNQNRDYYQQQQPSRYDYNQRNDSYNSPNQPYNQQGYYNNQNPSSSNNSQGYYNNQNPSSSNNSQGYNNPNGSSFNNQQGYYANRQDPSQNNENPNSDPQISKRINDAVGPGWLSKGYPNVTFEVNNGNVTLSGTVNSLDDKKKIEDSVRKIDGVRQINNQITVNPSDKATSYLRSFTNLADNDSKIRTAEENYPQDSAATDSDRLLNAEIRAKLKGWFTNNYDGLSIITKNGVVTIIGTVDSADDLKKLNEKVKNIKGVNSVNNQAQIKK